MTAPRHPDLHRAHRRRLLDALQPGDAVLLFASPHHIRSNDTEYRYRPDSDLWYLTGWEQPECAVLLRKDAAQPFLMFVQPRNPERETWEGRRPGPEGAVARFGADAAWPYDELATRLPDLLMGYRDLHYAVARDADHDQLVIGAIRAARRKARRNGLDVPDAFIDPARVLHELRLFKSEAELELMRRAADITCQAHRLAMAMTAPGVAEYELEAALDGAFRRMGGNGPGYSTIVGGGANATILHYVENRDPLRDGDLVCVDAGCEYDFYTADITRTWPVNGRFSPAQRQLYQLVLDAQLAAIDRVRPGVSHKEIHDTTVAILTRGMVRLGLLAYDRAAEEEAVGKLEIELPDPLPDDATEDQLVDRLIETERYKRYYMHGTGHWLGIDVHDVGAYVALGDSRRTQPGMVQTIEPGLYVAPDDEQAPERFRGIGIRIEDDVLCTEAGPVVLTAGVPKAIEEIEALVGSELRAR
ncbi:aminopeptidase P N-terminal domain-containing protein [Myxococcota bacterium]|nr:aminopeptidase P N-terminal domain-containing protein [Myxococcota bacterium]